jgi:hypothetical protein
MKQSDREASNEAFHQDARKLRQRVESGELDPERVAEHLEDAAEQAEGQGDSEADEAQAELDRFIDANRRASRRR